MDDQRPKVGTGVIIFKDNKVLLGKRKSIHGNGAWSFPGGHLEHKESFEDCVKRETKEEAGIEIKDIEFIWATNDIFEENEKHYVTIFMKANYASGEIKITEPDKWEKWEWFDVEDLPENLFLPIRNLFKVWQLKNYS